MINKKQMLMERMNAAKMVIDLEKAPRRVSDAIYYLLKEKGYKSQKEIAKLVNCMPSNLSGLKNGRKDATTESLLLRFTHTFSSVFNRDWLLYGDGEMLKTSEEATSKASTLINQSCAENFPNAIVNDENITVSENGCVKNTYGDSPAEERKWCPVVPTSMAKQPDFDIMGHVSKQMGGNFERLYSGTACIDVWHYVTDNDLYPYYWKGDCLGLKAYEPNDFRIKTGNVYVVDTKRDGFIFRRFRLDENGDFESYTFNDTDPQKFIIPKHDVIRVYSVVLMFRY